MMKSAIRKSISKIGNLLPFKTNMSFQMARDMLQEFSKKPIGTCYTENNIKLEWDLQIIVPCYNVEKWVRQCLESVLKQKTNYRVLISIVNDGSTDNTAYILQDIVEHNLPISEGGYSLELITQTNRGFSGARNIALSEIKGTYIMFLDSDDILADGAIQAMLDAAFQYDAEILQGSYYTFADHMGQIKDYIVLNDGVLNDNRGVFSGYPWGKLYKYNVMEHFHFPEGFWFEDTPLSFMIAALQYRCAAIRDIVYGYRQNPEGISATASKKKRSVESYWITEECLKEFPIFGLTYDQRAYEYLLQQSVMNAKRARHLPLGIRKAEFVLTMELMEKYFAGLKTEISEMKSIENALKKRQFIKFDMLTLGR